MRSSLSVARMARPSASISAPAFPATAARASSSQAGPSNPTAKKQKQKSLPKPVLRDLVKLHHTSSTFMHDPSQIPKAFEYAFRAGQPEYSTYADLVHAVQQQQSSELIPYDPRGPARRSSATSFHNSIVSSDEPVQTFGRDTKRWSDRGARAFGEEATLTEREKQVREALFGTYERGPGEGVKPGLEGIEEWLEKEGTSAEQVAKDWQDRHKEV